MWSSSNNIPPMIRMQEFESGEEVLVNLDHITSITNEKSNTTAYKRARVTFRHKDDYVHVRGTVDEVWKALHR